MAFQDHATAGRVITGGLVAGPVLLDKDCTVGDLLAPAGRDGWVPAVGAEALLVAGGSAPKGSTIQAYRFATIDFGPDCDAEPGEALYGASDPPGGYTTEGTGAPIGRMLNASLASITPNAIAAPAPPPVQRAAAAAEDQPDRGTGAPNPGGSRRRPD